MAVRAGKTYQVRLVTSGLHCHWLHTLYSPARPRYSQAVEDLLFSYFVGFARHTYGQQLAAYELAVATLDLRAPQQWYPYARAIHRKIVYHGGEHVVLRWCVLQLMARATAVAPLCSCNPPQDCVPWG